MFEVSGERAARNTFARELKGSEVRGLRALSVGASDSSLLVAALKTMAMGDTNACEIAQESCLALAYESGLLHADSFLSPAALAPRGDVAAGIIIDDCLTVCKEKATINATGRRHPTSRQPVVAPPVRRQSAGYMPAMLSINFADTTKRLFGEKTPW